MFGRVTTPLIQQCFRIPLRATGPLRTHRHGFHEIVHCSAGRGVQYVDRDRHAIAPGSVVVLPANMEHGVRTVGEEPCVLDVIYLSREGVTQAVREDDLIGVVMGRLVDLADSGRCVVPLEPDSQATVRTVLEAMTHEDRQRSAGYAAATTGLLLQLSAILLRDRKLRPHFRDRFAGNPSAERIRRVEGYIQTHYMQPLTVARMASIACLSRSQFHAAFKAATGKTLVQYLQAVRVGHASALLAEGRLPILEVAMRCGFGNLSHFYQVFQAHTGRTPGSVSGAGT